MDKEVLNSRLPEDLVNVIMDFKPRDTDMKSPTSALIKDMMCHFNGEERPFIWVMRRRWYPSNGWLFNLHMFQLGQYTERYWDMNVFLNDPLADTHWWDRKLKDDDGESTDNSSNEDSDDGSDDESGFYCDCCAELWNDCQCICSNCGFEYNRCRYGCYNGHD